MSSPSFDQAKPTGTTAVCRPAVVVADDGAVTRRKLSLLLESEFEVHTAEDGRQALELCRRYRPAVLLSDMQMPVMNGLELVRRAKADPDLASMPVILLTADDSEDSRVAGLDGGADDFVAKSCGPRELRSRVRAACRLHKTQRALEAAVRQLEGLPQLTTALAAPLVGRGAGPASSISIGTCLLAHVEGRRFAINLEWVSQILPMLALTPAPGGSPSLLGLANLGGEPIPVFELRRLFGLQAAACDLDHRIVVGSARAGRVGLVVDEALGLCEPTSPRRLEPDDPIARRELIGAVALVSGSPCAILDPGAVIRRLRGAPPLAPKTGEEPARAGARDESKHPLGGPCVA